MRMCDRDMKNLMHFDEEKAKNVKFLPCPYYIFLSWVFRQNWFAIPITLIFCVSLLVRKFIAIDL